MKFDSYSILKENKMAQYKYHSCLDVNKDGFLELKIFNCMFHEISLPKFKRAKEKMSDAEYKDLESIGDANIFTYQSAGSDSYELKHKYGKYTLGIRDYFETNISFIQKIKNLFRKVDSPEKTFNLVKTMQEEINPNIEKESLEKFELLLKRAKETNQISLCEIIEKHKNIFLNELVLAKNGFKKYITEEQAVVFMKNSNKGVRIDFLRGYTRSIPLSVAELKAKADALNVFDNYVVMHYDPSLKVLKEQESSRNVKEAVTVAKDPILFGIIFGSRRLYYVADWITDDDDLTLDKLMSELKGPIARQNELREQLEYDVQHLGETIEYIESIE